MPSIKAPTATAIAPAPSTTASATTTTIDSLQAWLKENWKLVAIVGGASVVVSAAAWLYLRDDGKSRRATRRSTSAKPPSTKRRDSIVEYETSANVNAEQEAQKVATETASKPDADADADASLPAAAAAAVDPDVESRANAAKQEGNQLYATKKYEEAIEKYTEAIELFGGESVRNRKCAVFYSNRAACWSGLGDFDRVIADCSKALEMDANYVKALHRRAVALERMNRFHESVHDFTLVCCLDEFKNQQLVEAADRVLRKFAKTKCAEMTMADRQQALPSTSFIAAYLGSFRFAYDDEKQEAATEDGLTAGDEAFKRAVEAYRQSNWQAAFDAVRQALTSDDESQLPKKYLAQALNMRGTFYFLMGRSAESRQDYAQSLVADPTLINSMIKLASVMIEGDVEAGLPQALALFEKAQQQNPTDVDLYYHRGQIYFLVQEYQRALDDYQQAIDLDGAFVYPFIQRAVCEYRLGNFNKSVKLFEQMRKKFPNNAEIHFYHGEVLLDHQEVDNALVCFERATKINPSLPLPYLNQAIIYSHVKGNVQRGVECTKKAIEVDPRCDLAYMHLAQMFMAQGLVDQAIEMYDQALSLARSAMDVENALMGIEASRAQKAALEYVGKLRA